ncbi:GNAT family N-acetyltransferase [Microbispora amethystogenes]|uniref:GNAT family N-acetyltransferase n=1 Tax=Microbispora amethystogenes TaxID=1427754 RepID=UPI003401B6BE
MTRSVAEACDVLLRDGGMAHIRPLRPSDRAALHALIARSSPRSAYLRFFAGGTASAHAYMDLITGPGYLGHALVALADGLVVGVAEYIPGPGGAEAEVGILLDDRVHGQGLGTLLLEHVALDAADAGVEDLVATVLPENRAMLRVLHDLGLPVEQRYERGQVEIRIAARPTERLVAEIEARAHEAERGSLAHVFTPGSVAVIGDVLDPDGLGNRVLRDLVAGGFPGPIHPVDPRAAQTPPAAEVFPDTHISCEARMPPEAHLSPATETPRTGSASPDVEESRADEMPPVAEVCGLPVHAGVAAVPGPVDLAVVAVPAPAVLGVARECARRRVRALVVLTGGFAEAGDREAERELLHVCREAGMRLVGPGSLGVVNTAARLHAGLLPVRPAAGPLGLMAQSGTAAVALLEGAGRLGLGVSSFASVGDKADVSGNDLLEYWEDDPATRVIALHLESFGNPRRFGRIARRIGARKPIIVMKRARHAPESPSIRANTAITASGVASTVATASGVADTAATASAGASTGSAASGAVSAAASGGANSAGTGPSAASMEAAVDALLRACGAIREDSVPGMLDTARLLAFQPLPDGPRVAIVSDSGHAAVHAAATSSACERVGLVVSDLCPATVAALHARLRSGSALGSPLDLTDHHTADPTADLTEHPTTDRSGGCTAEADAGGVGDFAAAIKAVLGNVDDIAFAITAVLVDPGVDAVFVVSAPPSGPDQGAVRQATREAIAAATRGATKPVLACLAGWDGLIDGRIPAYTTPERATHALAQAAGYAAWRARPVPAPEELPGVDPPLARRLVAADLAAHPEGRLLDDRTAARLLAAYGIRVGEPVADPVADPAAEKAAETTAGPVPGAEGVQGVEMVVRGIAYETFGPLVMVGPGSTAPGRPGLPGVNTDDQAGAHAGDHAFRVPPIDRAEAGRMIGESCRAALPHSHRGLPDAGLRALEDQIVRVGRLMDDQPSVAGIDLDPVVVTPYGAVVVHARVRLAPAPPLPSPFRRRLR